MIRSSTDRTRLFGALTLMALLAGYADLWRGDTTIAPVLLTVAYVIGVPATLLAVRQPRT